MTNDSIERRKFARVCVPPHKFFAFCHETSTTKMIMDIGMGGIRIESHPPDKIRPESVMIDIYSISHKGFDLAGILCRVVYDIASLAEDSTFSGTDSRICGLQYTKLTEEQKDKLEHFIEFVNTNFSDKPNG